MERTNNRKVQQGVVVSDKMDKTVCVQVERRLPHPLYKKYFKRSSKFLVHDEENTCNKGDFVRFVECRPLSKNKNWRLLNIIQRKA